MARTGTSISKKHLEVQLEGLKTLESPRLRLEQYHVSAEVASELLFMAGFEHDDLQGKVVDLGTGTGRLAIGACLMGARRVLGLDVDRRALVVAEENARKAAVDVDWVVSDLDGIRGRFDTVVMNPPFGTRVRHNDVRFLSRGLELASIVYSIHKSSTRPFLLGLAGKMGWKMDGVRSMKMKIPHLFSFHKREWKMIEVDLYRIIG